MKRKSDLFFLFTLIVSLGFSQNTILKGNVIAEENVESIHVINKTQNIHTTTNDKGSFEIEAIKNDTIVLTSVQYNKYTHIITADDIKNKIINISLLVQVNKLPEAVIGFTLTGDLSKDVLNSDAKRPIDFYDFGIPGYTGKPKTKSERILYEASNFSDNLPIAIINAISGRTKEFKKRLALEANTKLMNALKNRLSEVFFKANGLEEGLRADFFYFCAEDEAFKKRCESNDLEALKFMKEKYLKYKENQGTKE